MLVCVTTMSSDFYIYRGIRIVVFIFLTKQITHILPTDNCTIYQKSTCDIDFTITVYLIDYIFKTSSNVNKIYIFEWH